MFGIDHLLLNIFLILVSIFIYFSFDFHRKKRHRNTLIVGLLCGITVILCMAFPFQFFPGYIYDLRIIPLLISLLYGGVPAGCGVLIVLFAYRFYIGGDGLQVTLFGYSATTILTLFFLRGYSKLPSLNKKLVGVSLALFSSVLITILSVIRLEQAAVLNETYGLFFIGYCILHVLCMWMAIFLIETMKENIEMRNEIQRAEKLQILGELAAAIAHEIRNPMTVVRGFMQLLGSRTTNETDLNYTKMAIEELDRAETIISDYLAYAKPEMEKKETLDVRKQLMNVINIMEPYVNYNGIEISLNLEESLFIIADSKKIIQVFINLIKNSVEVMEEGGMIHINGYLKKKYVIIDVIDNGTGMTNDQIQRLGNPFYSTKDNGTGLGLMVSYRIIQAIDGRIYVQSEKGKGTKFSIWIPSVTGEAAP